MAISDDGKYLYVSLSQAGRIARIDLDTHQYDLTIDLGTNNFYRISAEDMVVVPGRIGPALDRFESCSWSERDGA